jgi:hypothetical protein
MSGICLSHYLYVSLTLFLSLSLSLPLFFCLSHSLSVCLVPGILTEGEGSVLLVLTGSDQLLIIMKQLFFFFYTKNSLNEKVNCNEHFPRVRAP